MFQHVAPAPPDKILGLSEAFRKDPHPQKINLGVGVFKDEAGLTPVLDVVKEAERRIVTNESTKAYLPIEGHPRFGEVVREMLFGAAHEITSSGRAVTAHTPGGTGALRVVGDLLARVRPSSKIWLSQPTWPNHSQIFGTVGLETRTYPHYDAATHGLDFAGQEAALASVEEGDVVVLQGCCHNPSGVDPTPEQWRRIGELLAERRAVPLIDFAYQGFGDGLEEDATGVRELCSQLPEVMICSSFSKSFGLYSERVGALTVVASSASEAQNVLSQIKQSVRASYSNPPEHGGAIVTTVYDDAELRRQWREELAAMRRRIQQIRRLFATQLDQRGVRLAAGGNDFIYQQKGMFSFSGLDADQVRILRDNFSIYIVGSGRINVAGITESNMAVLCDAIAAVVGAGASREA